jgi:hypothetical protein
VEHFEKKLKEVDGEDIFNFIGAILPVSSSAYLENIDEKEEKQKADIAHFNKVIMREKQLGPGETHKGDIFIEAPPKNIRKRSDIKLSFGTGIDRLTVIIGLANEGESVAPGMKYVDLTQQVKEEQNDTVVEEENSNPCNSEKVYVLEELNHIDSIDYQSQCDRNIYKKAAIATVITHLNKCPSSSDNNNNLTTFEGLMIESELTAA